MKTIKHVLLAIVMITGLGVIWSQPVAAIDNPCADKPEGSARNDCMNSEVFQTYCDGLSDAEKQTQRCPSTQSSSSSGNSSSSSSNSGSSSSNSSSGLDNCGKTFLTFQPWFNGLCRNGQIVGPQDPAFANGGLALYIWIIVLNILAILLQLVGYLSVGFIIWGGFSYILAQGDPGKISMATKTVINAVVGLVIAIFANVIVNTILFFIAPSGAKI